MQVLLRREHATETMTVNLDGYGGFDNDVRLKEGWFQLPEARFDDVIGSGTDTKMGISVTTEVLSKFSFLIKFSRALQFQ